MAGAMGGLGDAAGAASALGGLGGLSALGAAGLPGGAEGMMAAAGGAAGAAGAVGELPLPPGWEQEYDEEEQAYYYVSPEGETTWDRPPPDPAALAGAAGALGALSGTGGAAGAAGVLGALGGMGGAAGALGALGGAGALGALGGAGLAASVAPMGGGGNALSALQGHLTSAAKAEGISFDKPALPKIASILPKLQRKDQGDARPVRGFMSMASGTKDQIYVYVPDALVLGDKRDKLTAAKLLSLVRCFDAALPPLLEPCLTPRCPHVRLQCRLN